METEIKSPSVLNAFLYNELLSLVAALVVVAIFVVLVALVVAFCAVLIDFK